MLNNRFRQTLDSEKLKKQGYGLEAIKRLKSGRSIVYKIGETIVEEYPDGSRFEMTLDENYKPLRVREVDSRPDRLD